MRDAEHKAQFAQLVREHQTFVWRSARRLGVPLADVDDAVQEVFLLASRQLDVIEDPRGYLFQTCAYVAGHVRRSARRRRETDDKLEHAEADGSATPERNAENAEAREQLQTILEAMPDDIRSSFVLFELEGFKISEIAEITKAPIGTVGSRLRRGREIFLSCVEAFGRGER
jgi:RNA polymerase sigma-70 factor (ECF subfamily)